MNEMMKVLYIQVGKKPQVIEIKHTLKEMQRLVGGIISAYSPFDDGSVIILNDTGKIDGLEFNRVVYDENGERLPATYANFLITPSAVIMPVYNQPRNDSMARQMLSIAFADREIITVDCSALIRQHGSLHCATMQIPRSWLPL